MFRNVMIFNGQELLAPRQTFPLEDHPLWTCLITTVGFIGLTSQLTSRIYHPCPRRYRKREFHTVSVCQETGKAIVTVFQKTHYSKKKKSRLTAS
jgi:hypothetical protein